LLHEPRYPNQTTVSPNHLSYVDFFAKHLSFAMQAEMLRINRSRGSDLFSVTLKFPWHVYYNELLSICSCNLFVDVRRLNNEPFFCCFFFQTYKNKARTRKRIAVDNAELTMILLFTLDFVWIFKKSPLSIPWQWKLELEWQ
jgi:hypothetical protein